MYFLRLDSAVDIQISAEAIYSVIEKHDIFRCRFVMDTVKGELGNRSDGEAKPVTAEFMITGDKE